MLWLALHLPQLPLEAWSAGLGASAAGRPRALLHQHQVQQLDALALERGLRPGMKRATALALAPDLLLGQASPAREVQALRAVAHVALGFSPAVAWATPAGARAGEAVLAGHGAPAGPDLPIRPPPAWAARAGAGAGARAGAGAGAGAGAAAAPAAAVPALEPASAACPPAAPDATTRDAITPDAITPDAIAADDNPLAPASSPALVGVRLEVQSCLRYFGGLPALLQRLRAALAPLGHQLRIACAPTALGAALLAAAHDDLGCDGPHARQLAALQPLLDALPLALLGPAQAQAQADALQAAGLRTLGDLRQLPREGLARRFGPALLADIDRARGRLPEAHRWLTLPPRFAERIELHHRADSTAQLQAGAELLLARLLAWAQARQGRVRELQLVMHHGARHRHDSTAPEHSTLRIAPAQPAADARHLQRLLAEHLARLPLPAPVLELSLHCDALQQAEAPSAELFTHGPGGAQSSPDQQRAGLAGLVERLQARLGAQQVRSLHPVADRRPECSTRWQAADAAQLAAPPARVPVRRTSGRPMVLSGAGAGTGTARSASAQTSVARTAAHAGPEGRLLSAQPLWLLPQPRPLQEGAQGPLLDGRPLQLLVGPERLETGWWDAGAPALRDYFIAQAADGALVWLYRDRLAAADTGHTARQTPGPVPGWFLHGWFG